MTDKEKQFLLKLLSLFKIDGKPAHEVATEGQIEIFGAIVLRKNKWVEIITATQYGKSLFVALGLIIITAVQGELVSIVAPTDEKTKIIMRYFISHLGDHPLFYSQLEKETKVDKLMMETTKDRIIFKNKGGIFLITVNAGNSKKSFEAAMGEGSKNVIMDESALVPNDTEATVFRMISGKGTDIFYCKLGNPWFRNHFYRSSRDPDFKQIFIDYEQGLAEGRFTKDVIDKAREKPFFSVLYECKFPDDKAMDADGYVRLVTDSDLERCVVDYGGHTDPVILGVDPAAGGDNSAIVASSALMQEVMFNQKLNNTMDLVGVIVDIFRQIKAEYIVVDKTGVGQGVFDKLVDMDYPVKGVNFSDKTEDEGMYNKKAELYWLERKWLLSGGKLKRNPAWNEFETIKWKNKNGCVIIQPKEELFRAGLSSPNVVDAAVLARAVGTNEIKNRRLAKQRGGVFHDKSIDIWRGEEREVGGIFG